VSRCDHGFLEGVVDCPEGCHWVRPPPARQGKARRRTDAEIIRALEFSPSARQAAILLGYTNPAALYARARLSPAVKEAMRKHRSSKHPSFHDMTGQTVDTWTVLERRENTANGTAQWSCRHICGAVRLIEGTLLRSRPPKFCSNCTRIVNRRKGGT